MDVLRIIGDLAFQLLVIAGISLLIIKSRRRSVKSHATINNDSSISNNANRRQQMNLRRQWRGLAGIKTSPAEASVKNMVSSAQPLTSATTPPAASAAATEAMTTEEAAPVTSAEFQATMITPEIEEFSDTVENLECIPQPPLQHSGDNDSTLELSMDEPDLNSVPAVSEVLALSPSTFQSPAVDVSAGAVDAIVHDNDVIAAAEAVVTTDGVDCYISEIERLTMENDAYRNQIAVMQTENKRLEDEISGMLQLLQIVQSQSSRRSSTSLKTAIEEVDGLLSSEPVALSRQSSPTPSTSAEFGDFESIHFHIVFVGDSGVGKTSFIQRICNDNYNDNMPTFRVTTGVDFLTKTLEINRCSVTLQLWDTAGQERYRSLTKQYFRKADGIVIMYDVTSETSFCNVRSWIDSVQANSNDGTAFVLVGNKMDLMDDNAYRAVHQTDGSELARDFGAAAFSEVSAKTGAGCSKVIEGITRVLMTLRRQKSLPNTAQSSINLSSQPPDGYNRRLQSSCCGRQFSLHYRKKSA